MKFSIVIPTYNEEADIAGTLDVLVALDYKDKEIIVVDDSNDSTPDIVRRYSQKGVNLICPGKRGGRCEARNIGILAASGEIVVILNADVRPKPDFLSKLIPYYEKGYDYVLVQSRVSNTDELWARYVDSMAGAAYRDGPSWMEWTEGFSCRREVAIKAGLFPTGFAVPICAGEDGFFGVSLKKSGAKKKIDLTIVVDHVAPSTFKEYWQIRMGRGKGSPQVHRFLDQWSFIRISLWATLRMIKNMLYVITLFPIFIIVSSAIYYSKNSMKDIFVFMFAWVVEQAAFSVGEWQSLFEIMTKEKEIRSSFNK